MGTARSAGGARKDSHFSHFWLEDAIAPHKLSEVRTIFQVMRQRRQGRKEVMFRFFGQISPFIFGGSISVVTTFAARTSCYGFFFWTERFGECNYLEELRRGTGSEKVSTSLGKLGLES